MQVSATFGDFEQFASAMKTAMPKYLIQETAKALTKIGKSDILKMKTEQLQGGQGGSLNIKFKGFANSFKSKATDAGEVSNNVTSLDQLKLSEYTGAKPFAIFQTGGTITPKNSKTLLVMTPIGRKLFKNRIELKRAIDTGEVIIIKTKIGPALVRNLNKLNRRGQIARGSRTDILAWLKPSVTEEKRIGFFKNFADNENMHEVFLGMAADEAMRKTVVDSTK
jgi:hypothetical protein